MKDEGVYRPGTPELMMLTSCIMGILSSGFLVETKSQESLLR